MPPPFRADHVGSLLRPRRLLDARAQFDAGRLSREELRRVEDEAIGDAVAMQREVGLQSATDGEFRRGSWHMDFIYQLGGIERASEDLTVRFQSEQGEIEYTPAAIRVADRVHLQHPIFADDFQFLRSAVADGVTAKLTIPSPSMVHYRGGPAAIDERAYRDLDRFWSDLTDAYAHQIRAVADLGCTYLQLDDTSLAYLNDPRQRAAIASRGEDPEHLHETYIRHINEALAGRPQQLTVTTHLCRGNYRSSWAAAGGYEHVAEALFGGLAVDGFFLEYDDARSGSFEPLRFLASGKRVVLGLVTTKTGRLENRDLLLARIEEASRFVDVAQLCLSPQCGFSSTVEGNALTQDEQRAKLELVVSVAAEVWGDGQSPGSQPLR